MIKYMTVLACSFLLFACSEKASSKHEGATITKTQEKTVIETKNKTVVIDNEKMKAKLKANAESVKKSAKISAFD